MKKKIREIVREEIKSNNIILENAFFETGGAQSDCV